MGSFWKLYVKKVMALGSTTHCMFQRKFPCQNCLEVHMHGCTKENEISFIIIFLNKTVLADNPVFWVGSVVHLGQGWKQRWCRPAFGHLFNPIKKISVVKNKTFVEPNIIYILAEYFLLIVFYSTSNLSCTTLHWIRHLIFCQTLITWIPGNRNIM
jgi:hypothetical protein